MPSIEAMVTKKSNFHQGVLIYPLTPTASILIITSTTKTETKKYSTCSHHTGSSSPDSFALAAYTKMTFEPKMQPMTRDEKNG